MWKIFLCGCFIIASSLHAGDWEGMAVNLDKDKAKELVTFKWGENHLLIYDDDGRLLLCENTSVDLTPGVKEPGVVGGKQVEWHLWRTKGGEALVITHSYGGMSFYEDVYIIYGTHLGNKNYVVKVYGGTKGATIKDLDGDGEKELVIYDEAVAKPGDYYFRSSTKMVSKVGDKVKLLPSFVDSTVIVDQDDLSEADKISLPYVFSLSSGQCVGWLSQKEDFKRSVEIYNEWIEGLSDLVHNLQEVGERAKAKKVEKFLQSIR